MPEWLFIRYILAMLQGPISSSLGLSRVIDAKMAGEIYIQHVSGKLLTEFSTQLKSAYVKLHNLRFPMVVVTVTVINAFGKKKT